MQRKVANNQSRTKLTQNSSKLTQFHRQIHQFARHTFLIVCKKDKWQGKSLKQFFRNILAFGCEQNLPTSAGKLSVQMPEMMDLGRVANIN